MRPAQRAAIRHARGVDAREQEVLGLAMKGFSDAELAQLLALSPNTIASYTKHIYEKLAMSSRTEAIYEASRLGLIENR